MSGCRLLQARQAKRNNMLLLSENYLCKRNFGLLYVFLKQSVDGMAIVF